MKNGIGKQVNKVIKLLEAHVEWLSVDEEKEADAKAIYDDAYEAVLLEFSELQSRLESLEKDAARYRWLRNETDLVAGWHGGIALAGFAKTEKHQSELDVAMDAAMQANKGE